MSGGERRGELLSVMSLSPNVKSGADACLLAR